MAGICEDGGTIWNFHSNIFLLLLGQREREDPRDPAFNSWIEIVIRRCLLSLQEFIYSLLYTSICSFINILKVWSKLHCVRTIMVILMLIKS